jgi:glycosyltransferase involved in cell wall biosynthesis
MLEAMALRVPVVATDISGVRTALGAGDGGTEAGWIVPPDDATALGVMLQSVVTASRETPALVAERTTIAFQRAQERFGVERMVDECERVLFAADPRAGRTQRNVEK